MARSSAGSKASNIARKILNAMGGKSFLEKKFAGLNCMKTQYGSLDSLDGHPSGSRRSGSFFSKKNLVDRFTVSYDHSRGYRYVEEDDDDLNESTKLLDIRELNGKRKKLTKKKYWTIQDRADTVDRKMFRNNITFVPEVCDRINKDKNNNKTGSGSGKPNKQKKPKSLLKRTGKFIVKTARFMSMSTPYTHLYYNGVPNDMNGYDFTRNTYGLDPARSGYSYGYNPAIFF